MEQADLDQAKSNLEGLYQVRKHDSALAREKLEEAKEDAREIAIQMEEGKGYLFATSLNIERDIKALKEEIKWETEQMKTIRDFVAHPDEMETLVAQRLRLDHAIAAMGDQLREEVAKLQETCDQSRSRRQSTQPRHGNREDTGHTTGCTEQALQLGPSGRSSNQAPRGNREGTGYRYSDNSRPSSRGK